MKTWLKEKLFIFLIIVVMIIVVLWITAPFWIWHIIEPSGYVDQDQPCIPNYMGGCD